MLRAFRLAGRPQRRDLEPGLHGDAYLQEPRLPIQKGGPYRNAHCFETRLAGHRGTAELADVLHWGQPAKLLDPRI